MAAFYIDYENVHFNGTVGIDQLSEAEYVYMFYSPNANTMNMETVQHFMASKCGVDFIEANTGTPNALDFQMITFLYSGLGQDDFHYIISKDHGYDAAIKMGQRLGIENVKRYATIAEALRHYEKTCNLQENQADSYEGLESENIEVTDEEARSGVNISEDKYRKIVKEQIKKLVQKESNISLPKEELDVSFDGVSTCVNKLSFYHYLRSKLGDKRGRAVYSALNSEFEQLKLDLAG